MSMLCNDIYMQDHTSSRKKLIDSFLECTCITDKKILVINDKHGGLAELEINNENNKYIYVTSIDNCIKMLSNKIKCDFCISYTDNNGNKNIIYLELKGRNHQHGCYQLLETMEHFKNIYNNYIINCYLVAIPIPITSKLQKLIKKFKQKGSNLHIHNIIDIC